MPSKEELQAAAGRTVSDIIAPGLDVLFCGINPGLYTAWSGHHFARPGNRFWPALYRGGFTPRLLAPSEERELLQYGCGITNLVPRASVAASELSSEELRHGGAQLARKLKRFRPAVLAMLGIGAFQTAFHQRNVRLGQQAERMGDTIVWVLPNPSGLNANYTPAAFAELFSELKRAVEATGRKDPRNSRTLHRRG
jgi:double-stranded uracil-DNA glycosylase